MIGSDATKLLSSRRLTVLHDRSNVCRNVQSTTRQRVMDREILRFGRTCERGSRHQHALNGSTPLSLNNAFGAWQQPNEILLARFVKLNLQFDF